MTWQEMCDTLDSNHSALSAQNDKLTNEELEIIQRIEGILSSYKDIPESEITLAQKLDVMESLLVQQDIINRLARYDNIMQHQFYKIDSETLADLGEAIRTVLNSSSEEELKLPDMIQLLKEKRNYYDNMIDSYIDRTLSGAFTTYTSGKIGDYAFYDFNRLTEFYAPEATEIGVSAFYKCEDLDIFYAPKATKCTSSFGPEINFTSFYCGLNLGETAWASTSNANQPTFYQNKTIQILDLPNIKLIGAQAFQDCEALTDVTLNTATEIAANAFKNCKALKNISASLVTTIKSTAFNGCEQLEEIDFPAVTALTGSYVFSNCTTLKSVNMPLCTALGDTPFKGADSLTTVTLGVANPNTEFKGKTTLEVINLSNATALKSQAFEGCTALNTINCSKVNTINNSVFKNCTGLVEYNSPATTVGTQAFMGCTSLNGLSLVSGDTTVAIGQNAFEGCTSLQWDNVNIPKLSSIGNNAFKDCTAITWADLQRCDTLGDQVFANCTNLSYIYFGSLGTMPANAVRGLGVRTIDMPNCTTIAARAFENCTNLSQIFIPKIQTIGQSAFLGCTALSSIELMSNCTMISSYAFKGCTALTSLKLYSPTMVTLQTGVFNEVPDGQLTVYIPSGLMNTYMANNNWKKYNLVEMPEFGTKPVIVKDKGTNQTCYTAMAEFNDRSINDIFIGTTISGFYLAQPYYSNGAVVSYGTKSFYSIVDNKYFMGTGYEYNTSLSKYESKNDCKKYIYYTTEVNYWSAPTSRITRVGNFSTVAIGTGVTGSMMHDFYYWIAE